MSWISSIELSALLQGHTFQNASGVAQSQASLYLAMTFDLTWSSSRKDLREQGVH